jgi:hypothetical protein
MTTNNVLSDTANLFADTSHQLAEISSVIETIADQLETKALVGAPSIGNQPLPDVLRDRLMFNLNQMQHKLNEMAKELIADGNDQPHHPHYTVPPITQLSTLADTFAAFEPFLSDALITAPVQEALTQVLQPYPAAISRSLLLEYRLKAEQSQVDLSILLDPALDQGREWLAKNGNGVVRDFCGTWVEAGSSLHQTVETVWLEIDVGPSTSELQMPKEASVFFRLKDGAVTSALDQGLRLLQPDAAALERVRTCLDALPEGGSVRWAGVMARESRNVRLCLELPKPRIKPFLLDLGWQGSEEQLDLLVAGFGKMTDIVILAIELTPDGLSNTLGFECRYQFNRQPEIEPRWISLLDMLVKATLCSDEKRQALLNWNGLFYEPFTVNNKAQVLVRNLSHIKIGFQPGVAVTAKAYVSCNVRDFRAER